MRLMRWSPKGAVRVCSVDGCEREHYGRGFCQMHLMRWRRHGNASVVKAPGVQDRRMRQTDRVCEVPDCSRKHKGKGLCKVHFDRLHDRGIAPSVNAYRDYELAQAREIMERWAGVVPV